MGMNSWAAATPESAAATANTTERLRRAFISTTPERVHKASRFRVRQPTYRTWRLRAKLSGLDRIRGCTCAGPNTAAHAPSSTLSGFCERELETSYVQRA